MVFAEGLVGGGSFLEMEMEIIFDGGVLMVMVKWKEKEEKEDDGDML